MRAYHCSAWRWLYVAVLIYTRPAQDQAKKTSQHSASHINWTEWITKVKWLGGLVVRTYLRAVSKVDSISHSYVSGPCHCFGQWNELCMTDTVPVYKPRSCQTGSSHRQSFGTPLILRTHLPGGGSSSHPRRDCLKTNQGSNPTLYPNRQRAPIC